MTLDGHAIFFVAKSKCNSSWMTSGVARDELALKVANFLNIASTSVVHWGYFSSSRKNTQTESTLATIVALSAHEAERSLNAKYIVMHPSDKQIWSYSLPYGGKFNSEGKISNGTVYDHLGRVMIDSSELCAISDITEPLCYPKYENLNGKSTAQEIIIFLMAF